MRRAGWWLFVVVLAASGCRVHVSPYDPAIRFVGRVDTRDSDGPRFAWSGTWFTARFTGQSIRVRLRELPKAPDPEGRRFPNRYGVSIDGEPIQDVFADARGELAYERAGLTAGEHTLVVYKQTEALVGAAQLLGLALDSGARLLPPPPPAARRIELIGDSLSTGYGNEGESEKCAFSDKTQNHWKSYGAIAARALNAELVTIAWSGKGVVRNYDMKPGETVMPQLYGAALPEDPSSAWDFQRWVPDVVVINLGSNDFSAVDPGEAEFVAGLVALLGRVRAAYPNAHLVYVPGMLSDAWPKGVEALTRIRRYAQAAVAQRRTAGETRLALLELPSVEGEPMGCDWHPGLQTHERMAALLVEHLRARLGW